MLVIGIVLTSYDRYTCDLAIDTKDMFYTDNYIVMHLDNNYVVIHLDNMADEILH